MDKDVTRLVKGCLHCLITRTGETVPRPLVHALHGERPNEVLHLDFLYMGPSSDNKLYIFIVRDDHSSYVWLFATEAANAEEVANYLTTWVSSFGGMEWIVTDQGSHIKNQLIAELSSQFHVQHHFTTAYSPWANGTVERVCREVLRACKALCSEWKLAPRDWPAVVESVQSVLNQSPLRRLGLRDKNKKDVYRTPLEVFTGQLPGRPLLRALPFEKYKNAQTEDIARAAQLMHIDALQSSLEVFHKEVKLEATKSRKRMIDRHNRQTKVQAVNFQVGDFVLVRRATKKGHKLEFRWTGPRHIVFVKSYLVFTVENLLTSKREAIHARRLLLYRADMDGKAIDDKLIRAAEHTEAAYEDARSL